MYSVTELRDCMPLPFQTFQAFQNCLVPRILLCVRTELKRFQPRRPRQMSMCVCVYCVRNATPTVHHLSRTAFRINDTTQQGGCLRGLTTVYTPERIALWIPEIAITQLHELGN